jgi:Na+/H+-translocating membrane pyrophosphatase
VTRAAALPSRRGLTLALCAGRLVATAIREGAEGFLSTQYSSIARYVVIVAGMLFLLYLTRPPPHATISTFTMACLMSSTFCAGAFMSGLAGYIGMWISVRANVRTAAAATRSYQSSIDTALRGGAVCGLLVVGLCVFGLTTLFMLFRSMFPDTPSAFTPNLLVGFGFGASLVALFAQVGGEG